MRPQMLIKDQGVDVTDSGVRGLNELVRNTDEVFLFKNFAATSENSLHLGFSNESVFDSQRAVFRPLPASLLSSTIASSLKHSDIVGGLKYQPEGCGWDEVLDCIAAAKVSYGEKGVHNRLRNWARHADTTAGVLKGLAGMIPDEKGLSVLREGLVFLFQTWQRRMKNREEVLRHFEDVPRLLSAAMEKWKLYARDVRLKTAVEDLCHIVMDSINLLIHILLRTQEGSFFSKNMQRIPAIEATNIENASQSIESSKLALDACVARLEQERLASISKSSIKILSEAQATRQTVNEIRSESGIMMRVLEEIACTQQASSLATRSQGEDTMRDMFKQWMREILSANMQTGLYHLVEENEYRRQLGCDDAVIQRPSNTGEICITKAQLAQHLMLPETDSVEEDVELIRRQGTNVNTAGLERARRLMAAPEFSKWLSEDDPRLLMVDGHCKSLGNRKTSPLSVFCASLASTLSQSSSLVILQYYCGHHTIDSGDVPSGPVGLIKGLLGQLLNQSDDVLAQSLRLDRRLYDGDRDDIDQLCEIFEAVFLQINPLKITICIIDEIAEFEGAARGWAEGLCLVADQLRYLVHHTSITRKLKVLLTSANKSVLVSSRVEEEEKMALRGSGLPNHSIGRLVMSNSDLSLPSLPSQPSSSQEDR